MAAEESDELTGLPDADAPEPEPLGPPDTDPGGDGQVHGEEAMPGIPPDGEEPPGDG